MGGDSLTVDKLLALKDKMEAEALVPPVMVVKAWQLRQFDSMIEVLKDIPDNATLIGQNPREMADNYWRENE